MERQSAKVPSGIQLGNQWVRQVEIRPLNGYDEQMLAEKGSLPPFLKTTLLLERVASFDESDRNLNVPRLGPRAGTGRPHRADPANQKKHFWRHPPMRT